MYNYAKQSWGTVFYNTIFTQKFTLGIKTQMTIFNWIHFFPWCSLMWDCLTFFSAIISLSYITHKQFNINLRPDLQCTRRPTWFWLLYMGTPLFEFAPWALWWICALYRFSFRRVSGATATKGGGGNKPEPPRALIHVLIVPPFEMWMSWMEEAAQQL